MRRLWVGEKRSRECRHYLERDRSSHGDDMSYPPHNAPQLGWCEQGIMAAPSGSSSTTKRSDVSTARPRWSAGYVGVDILMWYSQNETKLCGTSPGMRAVGSFQRLVLTPREDATRETMATTIAARLPQNKIGPMRFTMGRSHRVGRPDASFRRRGPEGRQSPGRGGL